MILAKPHVFFFFYSSSTLFTPYGSFNHKTGAEDVRFTAESSHSESDTEADDSDDADAANVDADEDEPSSKSCSSPEQSFEKVPGEITDDQAKEEEDEEENSSVLQDDQSGLKMIMVKNVQAGDEVCLVCLISFLINSLFRIIFI